MNKNLRDKNALTRKIFGISANVFLVFFLVIIIFSPAAKGWVLARVISTGLFRPDPRQTDALATDIVMNIRTASGELLNTDQFRGKTIFVNLWASWCPPCRAEMSSLNELYLEMKNDTGIVFVFISEDENQEKAKQYLAANDFNLPVFTLAESLPSSVYTGKLPTTLVINPEGKLVYRHEQMADYNTAKFKKYLRTL